MNEESTPGVILHVEDDPGVRDSMAVLLRLAGFRPYAAENSESALSAAEALRDELDVLIVDYHLDSKMNGTEVAEAIARRLRRSLPTIILTGDPANAEVPLLTHAPVWVVGKPLDSEILIAALPALVKFHRAVRHLTSS
jgi:DNA-binding response OmpR family regulator